jgi:hypothetical protein
MAENENQTTQEQQQVDKELANRLSAIIEDANEKVVPLTKRIRQARHAPPGPPVIT